MNSNLPNNVADAVKFIFEITGLDEKFRKDITAVVENVRAYAEDDAADVVTVAPLTSEEIAAYRETVRASIAK